MKFIEIENFFLMRCMAEKVRQLHLMFSSANPRPLVECAAF
jgi:hypothetical protein